MILWVSIPIKSLNFTVQDLLPHTMKFQIFKGFFDEEVDLNTKLRKILNDEIEHWETNLGSLKTNIKCRKTSNYPV
jgi:hypothetical protein